MLVTLYKKGEVHFRLLDTNVYQVKANKWMKDFLLQAHVRISKMKICRRRQKKLHQKRAARADFFPRHSLNSLKTTVTATSLPQTTNLIGWMRENNCAARAARFLVQLFWRSLPNEDSKFSHLIFWQRKVAAGNLSFIYLISHDKHLCPASESAPHLFCTTWPTWNKIIAKHLT